MELSRYTNVHSGIEDLILMCTMGLMEDTNVHISFENVIIMCTIEKNMDFVGLIVHISFENWIPMCTMVAYCIQ
jgi:hypothetical protein